MGFRFESPHEAGIHAEASCQPTEQLGFQLISMGLLHLNGIIVGLWEFPKWGAFVESHARG